MLPRSKSAQRIVWVTGAGAGIGRALAREFCLNGDLVVLSGRSMDRLRSAARNIRIEGGRCEVRKCDVRSAAAVHATGRWIHRKFGKVDVVVNNAGVTSFKSVAHASIGEFDDVVKTNLHGLFYTTKAVLPGMIRRKSGILVNILSIAARKLYTGSGAYSASKAGAAALMDVLREEVRHQGIKVINIFPGATLTDIWLPKHRKRFAKVMVMPEDVARMVYFATVQPPEVMVEELTVRPQVGDLRV